MAKVTDEIRAEIVVEVNKAIANLRKMQRAQKDFGQKSESTFAGIRTSWIKLGVAFTSGAYAVRKVFDFGRAGASVKQLAYSFERLGGQLAPLQKAVAGTIDDATLMRFSNMADTLGINAQQFAELTEVSRAASKLLGIDMTYALESITTGTARQSKLWLDNLGIIISLDKANQDYAKTIGKTVKQLSDADKKQAFINATIERGRDLIGKAGAGGSATDGYDQLTTALKNFGDTLRQSVNDPMSAFTAMLARQVDLLNTPLPEGTMGALLGIYAEGKTPAFSLAYAGLEGALIQGQDATSKALAKLPKAPEGPTDEDRIKKAQLAYINTLGVMQDEEGNVIVGQATRINEALVQGMQGLTQAQLEELDKRRAMEVASAQQTLNFHVEHANAEIEVWKKKEEAKRQQQRDTIEATRMGFQALATMFPKMKGFAIAEAIVSTHQAITNALATKPFVPLGLASAALAAAKGFASVKAIKAQGISGAGAGGTGTYTFGGAVPTVPTSPAPSNISITVKGGQMLTVEDMAEGFADLLKASGGAVGNIKIAYTD